MKNQKIQEVRKFIETNCDTLTKIQSFEVIKSPSGLTDIRVQVDVPKEERNNPYLHEHWQIILGKKGGIKLADRTLFGGKDIDFSHSLRFFFKYGNPKLLRQKDGGV